MNAMARTIGWGLFCTGSWTWCIGMWLPLLLIDRWGWPGFWMFAIPNVLGCAAMGYVVGSRERSLQLVEQHRGAMRWFSVVTIAFQFFWITAIFGDLGFMPAVVLVLACCLAFLPSGAWLVLSALLALFVIGAFSSIGTGIMEQIGTAGSTPSIQLWGAAPIIALGFICSPYLDLTFHRARRETPSTHSFAIFGLAFLGILLFVTCVFHVDAPEPRALVLMFWILQVTFTVGAHLRELRMTNQPTPNRWGETRWLLLLALLPVPIVWLVYGLGDPRAEDWLLKDTYLRFLAFYGLVVPAWVLAFMGPRRPAQRSLAALLAIGAAVVIALPFGEWGMIHGTTWWLLPPVAIVIIVALALPRAKASEPA